MKIIPQQLQHTLQYGSIDAIGHEHVLRHIDNAGSLTSQVVARSEKNVKAMVVLVLILVQRLVFTA